MMTKSVKVLYSSLTVLTFLYICLISGLYSEWVLLGEFSVSSDAAAVFDTKLRLGIPYDTPLTDEQVTELLSKKVEKQQNLAVFAILLGTFFSLAAVSAISILSNK